MDYLRLSQNRLIRCSPRRHPWLRRIERATMGFLGLACCHAAFAAPVLRCEVTYAGTLHVIEAHPVADPYRVASVDIGGRFRFKAVMVGDSANSGRVDSITLYAYLETRRQPLLVQQATYRPPFQTTAQPYALTGEQHLFAGPVERELMYHCTLQGVQP